jgi:hypothetical protein
MKSMIYEYQKAILKKKVKALVLLALSILIVVVTNLSKQLKK